MACNVHYISVHRHCCNKSSAICHALLKSHQHHYAQSLTLWTCQQHCYRSISFCCPNVCTGNCILTIKTPVLVSKARTPRPSQIKHTCSLKLHQWPISNIGIDLAHPSHSLFQYPCDYHHNQSFLGFQWQKLFTHRHPAFSIIIPLLH